MIQGLFHQLRGVPVRLLLVDLEHAEDVRIEGRGRIEPVEGVGLLLGLSARRRKNPALHGNDPQPLQLVQLIDESGLVPEGAAARGPQSPARSG